MNAIQMTVEQEKAMADDFEDSEELLSAVGGGLGRKSSQLEAQLERTKELLLTAEAEEREAKTAMIRAREQVRVYSFFLLLFLLRLLLFL